MNSYDPQIIIDKFAPFIGTQVLRDEPGYGYPELGILKDFSFDSSSQTYRIECEFPGQRESVLVREIPIDSFAVGWAETALCPEGREGTASFVDIRDTQPAKALALIDVHMSLNADQILELFPTRADLRDLKATG